MKHRVTLSNGQHVILEEDGDKGIILIAAAAGPHTPDEVGAYIAHITFAGVLGLCDSVGWPGLLVTGLQPQQEKPDPVMTMPIPATLTELEAITIRQAANPENRDAHLDFVIHRRLAWGSVVFEAVSDRAKRPNPTLRRARYVAANRLGRLLADEDFLLGFVGDGLATGYPRLSQVDWHKAVLWTSGPLPATSAEAPVVGRVPFEIISEFTINRPRELFHAVRVFDVSEPGTGEDVAAWTRAMFGDNVSCKRVDFLKREAFSRTVRIFVDPDEALRAIEIKETDKAHKG